METLTTVLAMRNARRALLQTPAETLGLVPTMGALHEGHLSLVRAAKARCRRVAVSIFVNPLQFGAGEDLARYPRTFEQDCRLLEREGVDIVFAPTAEEMYPPGSGTVVDVPGIGDRLDGRSRPRHFRGVATVVAKLFSLIRPDAAFFGQKDAAQVAVLRAMVRDLNLDLDLVVCPTVREADGLAMSSRNRYLSPEERVQALALSAALASLKASVDAGERRVPVLLGGLREQLAAAPGLRLDYAELVSPLTLEPVADLTEDTLVAVAAFLGSTRLIDNLIVPGVAVNSAKASTQELAGVGR